MTSEIQGEQGLKEGAWDSIHSVTATYLEGGKQVRYNLVSTVLLSMSTANAQYGEVDIAGSLNKSVSSLTAVRNNSIVRLKARSALPHHADGLANRSERNLDEDRHGRHLHKQNQVNHKHWQIAGGVHDQRGETQHAG